MALSSRRNPRFVRNFLRAALGFALAAQLSWMDVVGAWPEAFHAAQGMVCGSQDVVRWQTVAVQLPGVPSPPASAQLEGDNQQVPAHRQAPPSRG